MPDCYDPVSLGRRLLPFTIWLLFYIGIGIIIHCLSYLNLEAELCRDIGLAYVVLYLVQMIFFVISMLFMIIEKRRKDKYLYVLSENLEDRRIDDDYALFSDRVL